MAEVVTAIFEKGVLKPLRPLSLRERQKVRLYLIPEKDEDESERIVGLLVSAGLIRPVERAADPPPDPVSPSKRKELARILGSVPGKPLSEVVIEGRSYICDG